MKNAWRYYEILSFYTGVRTMNENDMMYGS